MDADEELLSGRATRRRWIYVLVTLPFLALMGSGVFFFMQRRQAAREVELVEQTTGAAFGCVASIRGDAPDAWGLERSLEHMARMARTTENEGSTEQERARFAQLSEDAARGCEALGELMRTATQESDSELYFGVPAKLAQPPDLEAPERWYRRVLPASREESVELARQIRTMAEQINARREERALMAQALPTEGNEASVLARVIELAPMPSERENQRTEVWPLADGVVVLRRGSIPRVPCDMRFINRLSCYNELLQRVSWEGEAGEPLALERPRRVSWWASFSPTPDGALWAVGGDERGRAVIGRYPPGEVDPELERLDVEIDAGASIVAGEGGRMGVRLSDGTVYTSRLDPVSFEPAERAPRPFVAEAAPGEGGRTLFLPDFGTLGLFGNEEFGWTSRLSGPDDEDDQLFRVIEARRRVSDIAALRSLPSGKVVALLQRFEEAPDAIVLSTDFGASWLARPSE